MNGKSLLGVLVATFVVLAAAAYAQSIRVPPQGSPALTVDLPPGWTSRVDENGNVDITHPSHHAQMRIAMIVDDGIEATSLQELAKNMLNAAHFALYTRTEPAAIGGHQGQAFYGSAVNSSGVQLTYKIVWVKLDARHAATTARLAAVGATTAETNSLDALVSRVRVIGAK
ncbi:MAG TPA: hypothetical protein VFB13_13980 [Reyranella sp.]|jgi:hypothetical protein|nr:hypothetical protein [Reyranella sp.]